MEETHFTDEISVFYLQRLELLLGGCWGKREGKESQAGSSLELFNSIWFKLKLFPKLPLLQNLLVKIAGNSSPCSFMTQQSQQTV